MRINLDPKAAGTWSAIHGTWTSTIRHPLPAHEAERWRQGLAWEHPNLASITPAASTHSNVPDTILCAARVARGLTFLTQGTALDLTTQTYLNPSDWRDRGLEFFILRDHLTIVQPGDEATRNHPEGHDERQWLCTLGLSKFGLDELEGFLPIGLPTNDLEELLMETADEVLRTGKSPKVGTQVRLPLLGRRIEIVRHRTAAPAGTMVGIREVAYNS